MHLKNLEDQLLRLYIIRDDPKWNADQRSAIIACIDAIKDVPDVFGYQNVPKMAEYFTKKYPRV